MATEQRPVIINPVLKLLTKPTVLGVTGRGKDPSKIVPDIYARRRENLISKIYELQRSRDVAAAMLGDWVLLWVGMDAKSLAATHTPDDLFGKADWVQILFAWQTGYVVQIKIAALNSLISRVSRPSTNAQKCDIFRIEDLVLFANLLLASNQFDAAWTQASFDDSERRVFDIRLPPVTLPALRRAAIEKLGRFIEEKRATLLLYRRVPVLPVQDSPAAINLSGAVRISGQAVQRVVSQLNDLADRRTDLPALSLTFSNKETFEQLIASGAIVRWDPVVPPFPTEVGTSIEAESPVEISDDAPIVGVIDGGYHGTRYTRAIAWREALNFVPDGVAARSHGAKVTAATVEGHLPSQGGMVEPFACKVGVVQAVPNPDATVHWSTSRLLGYLDRVFGNHPDTHVWNISANAPRVCDDYEVSDLGHGLATLARRHSKLIVISAGNRIEGQATRVAPPADCEAALVVSGRTFTGIGAGGPCINSRVGLGPEGMLKPDASWYSDHLAADGTTTTGTSFAAPLISRVAAHTWKHIAEATPDTVRALILNACDLTQYSHELGFGTPLIPALPWLCPPNGVVLAWSYPMKAKERYYWRGIQVPPSLIQNNRFVGRAKLTAILTPVVQMRGHNYTSTRLETSLQVPQKTGSPKKLVGSMDLNTREITARRDDAKWHPIRRHYGEFTETNGPHLGPNGTIDLYGRVYWRNDFQYSEEHMDEHAMRATFVVSLQSTDPNADTYNEFSRMMRQDIADMTIEIDQDIENDI